MCASVRIPFFLVVTRFFSSSRASTLRRQICDIIIFQTSRTHFDELSVRLFTFSYRSHNDRSASESRQSVINILTTHTSTNLYLDCIAYFY